jgi:predicted metalloendopeptidase
MTLEELTKEAPQIDWNSLLSHIFKHAGTNISIDLSTQIIVSDIPYITRMAEFITDEDQVSDVVIHNYIMWSFIQGFFFLTTNKLRQYEFEFNQVLVGIESDSEMSQRCLDFTSASLSYALSRKYVDKYFTAQDRSVANELFELIQTSYKKLMEEDNDNCSSTSSWMDEQTQRYTLKKLEKIAKNVGFPDWILSNEELDEFYGIVRIVWIIILTN